MIDLYYWPTPNGHKASIMLEECALPYRVKPVNILRSEQFRPAFLRINPNHKIPAIVDHDGPDGRSFSLFESGAILQYLAEKSGCLLPRAPRLAPDELVARADAYARLTGYPVQIQWALLAGINDGADEIEALAQLLAGRFAVLNLIPYNAVEGLDFARPSWEHAAAMARTLHRRGVLTKLRRSAGQDVEGGCGQLRTRAQAGSQPIRWQRPTLPPLDGAQLQ